MFFAGQDTLFTEKRGVLSMKKWMMGAGVGAAGLAAAGAMSYALTRELVSVAVDRECPGRIAEKARRKFTSTEKNRAFVAHLARMGMKLRRTPMQTVTIAARDGEMLVGHWYDCPSPRRIVIAMHGWRSSWDQSFGMVADFLHRNGCAVLFAEQRGQGASGGEHMGLGALEQHDCQSWATWAAEKGSLPIYLAGVSMGATTVLMASALELPETVRGIIADCGFTSPEEMGRFVMKNNLHLSYALRAMAADALCREKNKAGIRGHSAVTALKKNKRPVLFIHGSADSVVPVDMTYENYRACAGPKEILIVPGADHGMSYYLDKPRYEAALKSFWAKYDPR